MTLLVKCVHLPFVSVNIVLVFFDFPVKNNKNSLSDAEKLRKWWKRRTQNDKLRLCLKQK